jgi:glutathione synthase/RimK-type ligase-like ATP-grasp enzyme
MALSRAVILPYKIGSRSAKKLAQGLSELLHLRVRRVRPDGLYRPKLRSMVVNYGSNSSPFWWSRARRFLNSPVACAFGGNKLTAFRKFQEAGLAIPDFTNSHETATGWYNEGHTVVCRTLLNAHSGRGIVLASRESGRPLVRAPLYVIYKKKRKEFRVHVFQGAVIHVAEKRRMRRERRPEAFDGYIRNLTNGWIFASHDVVEPADLRALATSACRSLGMDFGAVDIIWNERENKSYLLEVNSAPGLEGTTLRKYTQAIYNWIRQQP